jgi:hypothetical protein
MNTGTAWRTRRMMVRTGWSLSGLFILFMIMDASMKLLRMAIVDQTMAQLGFPPGVGFKVGVLEGILLVLYCVPRTAILGAILFMGIFGGAAATHLRHGDPLLSHVLFGVYLGLLMWGGLWLRNPPLRALFPLARTASVTATD